jgi:undecaprenyl-diphosphatase
VAGADIAICVPLKEENFPMLKSLDSFGDKYLTLARTKSRDAFWFRLSHYADHSLLWFAIGTIEFIALLDYKLAIRFVVVMMIESGLTNGPIKYIFRRRRPHEKENTYIDGEPLPHGLRMPITSSFPSGHATAAMTAASLLSSGHNLIALIVFPLGILVAYSRMYTRMHHLSDVLAGLGLGLAFGYLACRFFIWN